MIGSSFTSGDSNRVNKFVVGSSISTGIENDRAVVNGSRIDHLSASELYQDRPGNTYIDFDTEFAKLEGASESLMSITPAKTYLSSDFPDMNNRTIDVAGMGSSDVVIINVDASVLSLNTPLNIVNSENKILVMNVINAPADFTIQSQIHYNNRANHETEDFSDANISWNFPSNVTNLAINAPFQGTIIAPRADVTANQNMDGTIIGKNVTLNAATNRWDPNEIFLADNPDNSGSSDSSTDTTSSDSSTDTTSSDSSTDTTSSDSSTNPTSGDSSSNPTNGNSDTDTPTPFHIDPSMSGEDANQVYPNNNDKTNQSNGMNSTIPQQGKGTDLDRNEFNSSANETTNVTDESRSMDFQDQDSQVLPKTNSASNKWLAIVGGMIIVLVVIVGFMRRKKHK